MKNSHLDGLAAAVVLLVLGRRGQGSKDWIYRSPARLSPRPAGIHPADAVDYDTTDISADPFYSLYFFYSLGVKTKSYCPFVDGPVGPSAIGFVDLSCRGVDYGRSIDNN